MLTCTCCERPIRRRAGVYAVALPLFQEITLPDGQRAAVRVGETDRALCPTCTARIEQAQQRRRAQRRGASPVKQYGSRAAV
jgi:hypothetical protein